MLVWIGLGILGPGIIPTILTLPGAIIATVAGLALLSPLMGAAASAFETTATRFPDVATFIVTASGTAAFGIGAVSWGLVVGLVVWWMDGLVRRG